MRNTVLAISFIALLMASYSVPQLAQAQSIERCDEPVCHVKITKDGFVPKTLIVKAGTTIIWTNEDDERRHTVTSGIPGEITHPLKSGLLATGDTYEFTFHIFGLFEGRYRYFDQVIPTMRGEIIVEPRPRAEPAKPPEPNIIKIDFNDPNSGVKKLVFPAGTVQDMVVDVDFLSLLITVTDVRELGTMEITLARYLIDAKRNGEDQQFIILINGEEAFYEETASTPTERTLEIVVPSGALHIEILGTYVIPEFPVAMLAIAGIFGAMVAMYRLRKSEPVSN